MKSPIHAFVLILLTITSLTASSSASDKDGAAKPLSQSAAPSTDQTAVPSSAANSNSRIIIGQKYCGSATPCVLSYHNDNNRDGVNPNERVLKASTLSSTNHPLPQWLATVDGEIYNQPLYLHQFEINGVAKNVVLVGTQNNSVYSFDSDSNSSSGTVLAHVNLNNASDLGSGYTEIAVPYTDLLSACNTVVPEVGITGTPVIDVSVTPPVLYVVSKHEDIDGDGNKSYRQKLHGLYADTLQEIPGSPVILDSAFAKKNVPAFNPLSNSQRPGLALAPEGSGVVKVWVAWGSHCDIKPYSGIAMGFTYNYNTLKFSNQTIFNDAATCTKQPCESGIWMSGAAPAVDKSGNIYLSTGNGGDTTQGAGEYSNSVLRLSNNGLQDFYSPPDYDALNKGKQYVACTNPNPSTCASPCSWDNTHQYCQRDFLKGDWDLSSGGVVLLKPTFGLTNPQIVTGGKEGMLYNVFSSNMGHIDAHNKDVGEWACTTGTAPAAGTVAQCFLAIDLANADDNSLGVWGAPAFLAGQQGTVNYNYLYVAGDKDVLRAYKLTNQSGVGLFNTQAATPVSGHLFGYPGAAPDVTWDKAESDLDNAIVWALDTSRIGKIGVKSGPAILYAYKALPKDNSLGAELWDTTAYNNTNPGAPAAIKFVVPTVVDGKIFVGGGAQGYEPGSANCPIPTATVQPTACGGLAMFK
ncbi:MAG TPA: hypothetical protein VF753_15785 [Terriglobales bacterium]